MKMYDKLMECKSIRDVFKKMMEPALCECNSDKERLDMFGLKYRKWFCIPSNERNNGHYYLTGITTDGMATFEMHGSYGNEKRDISRSLFQRDRDGDRLMNGHLNHHIVVSISSAEHDVHGRYARSRSEKKRMFYLGLLVYGHLLRMDYTYTSGGSYIQAFPIQYHGTRDEHHPRMGEDFAIWKKTGICEFYKDPYESWLRGECSPYVQDMLQDLEPCGYTDRQRMLKFAEQIVPHKEFMYVYYLDNVYNRAYWEEQRRLSGYADKNREMYRVVPFDVGKKVFTGA